MVHEDQDFETYDKPTHKTTPTGILSSYKKQLNMTPEDVMQKDYWNNMRNFKDDTVRQMDASSRETFTKEYTKRLRMNRDLSAPMPEKGEEYGNYEKYEKNSVELEVDEGLYDDGSDKFRKNYNNMMAQLNMSIGDGKREHTEKTIASTVANTNVHDGRMMEEFDHTLSQ